MKRNLGILETQFFAYVQMRKLRTAQAGDLVASVLKLAPEQERKLLSRLSRGGLIARVRQGLYLVPPSLPLGGAWAPSEALALNTLMEDVKGQYQICGPTAFNRYGFDEQIPNRTYAYNNRLFGDYTIGTLAMTLIKVADARLGETTDVVFYDGERATYASRVRTLVDAVYDWSRFKVCQRPMSGSEATCVRNASMLRNWSPLPYVSATPARFVAWEPCWNVKEWMMYC